MTNFTWPAYPKTDAQFDELMHAIDSVLADEGLKPFQRPIHVGRKFWEAFKWGGLVVPPKELADQPGFSGDVLMAKAHRWYELTYGGKLKSDWALGYVPVKLGNAFWKTRVPVFYGQLELFVDRDLSNQGIAIGSRGKLPTWNILCAVEELPQGFANRLSDQALNDYFDTYILAMEALAWRASLPTSNLLSLAHADYDQCTLDVLGGRYAQARWAAQQAVEKTLKGLLEIAGTAYPTGGPQGHSLQRLRELLSTHHRIELDDALIELAYCPPRVRYGEEVSTESQALLANHAVLTVLEQLSLSRAVSEIFKSS